MLCLFTQSCPTFVTPWMAVSQEAWPMGILWARILEWVAMPSSRGSSQSRDQTQVSCISGGFFTDWATREAQSLLLHAIKTHSSVTQSCSLLCDPMDCSTPGLPVHHQLPEPTQTHVHWVGDVIQQSHPLSFTPFSSHLQSFPASGSFQMSQFFTSGGQSIGVSVSASGLPMNI